MLAKNINKTGSAFRNIYVIESRQGWSNIQNSFEPDKDIILTYDFALRKMLEDSGGSAQYIDHLCEQSFMQENNFLMYQFFRDWHFDKDGNDIFQYRGVNFGFSLRIEIWNEFSFYVRSRLCLEQLRGIAYQQIYLDPTLPLLSEILRDMKLPFEFFEYSPSMVSTEETYFFPIHGWINERLRTRLFHHKLRDFLQTVQGLTMSWLDRAAACFVGSKAGVFVQEYHPTRLLLNRLQKISGVKVMQAHFSSSPKWTKFLYDRPIPIYGQIRTFQDPANLLMETFCCQHSARLILSNGVDITDEVYRTINKEVSKILPKVLRSLDCIMNYLDRHPLDLGILIGNVGQVAMLVDSVAKSRGVPSFIIINGLLGHDYLDEAKYATVINAYSESIKENYFRGMDNTVCLGDPRMDIYSNVSPKLINRVTPTIGIGVAGYSPIDLNSFLAVEFDFLEQVLLAIQSLVEKGQVIKVILKVRPNGYSRQYEEFTEEFFPGLVNTIFCDESMHTFFDQCDLYISTYSQTLFEASCLGIPVIYHKSDFEMSHPPFDGNTELVTTYDVNSLKNKLEQFLLGNDQFDAFLNRAVMEKYVGPLDGGNLERNLNFILGLLNKNSAEPIR